MIREQNEGVCENMVERRRCSEQEVGKEIG